MKLRFLLPCLALALTTVSLHAQFGLYLNPVGTHISNSKADSGTFAFLGSGTTSRTFYGVAIGGYYNAVATPKVAVGVDIRDTIVHANNASINTFLIGVRAAANPANYRLKPYVQVSVGEASSRAPTTTARLGRIAVEGFAGADYALGKHIDFRAVEVGYGTAQTVSSANFGGPTAYPASRLLSISTGLVFRIP